MTTTAASLFDMPGMAPLAEAAQWAQATLLGNVATALCVVAVALVGLMLMSGRIAVREAIRVALGCFVLLGSPIIAQGLHAAASDGLSSHEVSASAPRVQPTAHLPPPANYDPYAGASLRVD